MGYTTDVSEVTTTRPRAFPYKHCTRCGGSGHYSFNLMHGTMCYGCSGKGKAPASKKVAELSSRYATERRRIVTPVLSSVWPGDRIKLGGGEYRTVTSIEVTSERYGHSVVNGKATNIVSGVTVTFDDGEVVKTTTNAIAQRAVLKSEIRAQLWHLVEEAWAGLTKAQRKLVINPEDEAPDRSGEESQ